MVPTVAGFGDAVSTIERFALVGPGTISDTVVTCCRIPLMAVMSRVYVPGGVDEVVVIVRTAVLAFESVILNDDGLNEPLASLDKPVTLSATLPVKPPAGVTVTL